MDREFVNQELYEDDGIDPSRFHKPIRIGLLFSSKWIAKYEKEIIEWLSNSIDVELAGAFVNLESNDRTNQRKMISIIIKDSMTLIRKATFKLITFAENLYLIKFTKHRDHLTKFDLTKYLNEVIFVSPKFSQSRLSVTYPPEELFHFKEANLDLLINYSSPILRGELLNVPSLGVIGFHHGDNRDYRGGPAGFWEVFRKDRKSGFVIQKLSEELDGGLVLQRGSFKTQNLYLWNQANLRLKSNYYMKKVLREIAERRSLNFAEKQYPFDANLYSLPKVSTQVVYLYQVAKRLAIKLLRKFKLVKIPRWRIAYQSKAWREINLRKSRYMEWAPRIGLADPFLIDFEGKTFIFAEKLSHPECRGEIVMFELEADVLPKLETVISEEFHLSYPFVFEHDKRIYCLPETSEINEIRLYVSDDFPKQWRFQETLISNVDAVDSTLIQFNGLWWLFTNIDPVNIGQHDSELFIYYAENPVGCEWYSHPQNPIRIDPDGARMGGFVFDGTERYRVGQVHDFDSYGSKLLFFKIVELTTTSYLEEVVHVIGPRFSRNLFGVHHFYSDGRHTIFDFKK